MERSNGQRNTLADSAESALSAWPPWPGYQQARALQDTMANRVRIQDLTYPVRYILGVDCAFLKQPDRVIAGAVVWDRIENIFIEKSYAVRPLDVPYVPGYLSFREIPGILDALKHIHHHVDLIIADGQGIAHPRRIGLAAHLGVLLDMPTIGVAKSRLVGIHEMPSKDRGCFTPLWSDKEGSLLGGVLRTRCNVKPVYVSPGHRVGFLDALKIVLLCAIRYRLPEPQRAADRLVSILRRGGPIAS